MKFSSQTVTRLLSQYGAVAMLVVLLVVVSLTTPKFFTLNNLMNVARQVSINAIIASGMTFVIITAVITPMTSGKLNQSAMTEQIQKQAQKMDPAAPVVAPQQQQEGVNEVLDAINTVNFPVMIGSFLFFFLFGYLMYAALFAAIGGAVDSEADTQQFMLPMTAPLILAMVLAQFIIQEPTGPVAFWFSIIPLTSPVVMMVRIPFGVPYWEVGLSMALLILGFIAATWMAAKIYRTGILMYGKKVSYKELWKWLRY